MTQKSIPQAKKLPIQTLNRLRTIFQEKGWPHKGDLGEDYLGNFSATLENFTEDQQNVLIDLTREFNWIPEMEYMQLFDGALTKLVETFKSEERKTIILAPLLPADDVGKPKSSVMLLYLIKCHLIAIQRKYSNHNVTILESPLEYSNLKAENTSENSLLCLIDDFIGSGETALAALDYYVSLGASPEYTVVLALVAMRTGVETIQGRGYEVYVRNTLEKAISDRKDGNAEYYRKIMESIESQIKVKDEYLFGYSHSESLVRMIRTPNNTFPVYWLKNKKNKFPPFAR